MDENRDFSLEAMKREDQIVRILFLIKLSRKRFAIIRNGNFFHSISGNVAAKNDTKKFFLNLKKEKKL